MFGLNTEVFGLQRLISNFSFCHWLLEKLLKSILSVAEKLELPGFLQLRSFGPWGPLLFPSDSLLLLYTLHPSSPVYVLPSTGVFLLLEYVPKIAREICFCPLDLYPPAKLRRETIPSATGFFLLLTILLHSDTIPPFHKKIFCLFFPEMTYFNQ